MPKVKHPETLKDYRAVALTEHVMKDFGRLVLQQLSSLVKSSMDPLQFSYWVTVGLDDSITSLLHRAASHLEE